MFVHYLCLGLAHCVVFRLCLFLPKFTAAGFHQFGVFLMFYSCLTHSKTAEKQEDKKEQERTVPKPQEEDTADLKVRNRSKLMNVTYQLQQVLYQECSVS